MPLKHRLSLAYCAVSLACSAALVYVVATFGARLPGQVMLVAPLVLVAAWLLAVLQVRTSLLRRATERLAVAFDRGDTTRARRALAELAECAPETPANVAAVRITQAGLLGVDGEHDAACRLLESIDPAPLASLQRALLFNNLAYARALAGRADDAVRAAEQAHALCPAHASARTRGRIVGTLGIARVRAGDYDQGVALLAAALTAGGSAHDQAARAFFLGDGLRAMGRVLEAREAYARASKTAPDSEWARRASERLSAVSAAPFRG